MVQELLKFKSRYGRPDLLVRWAGRNASGHTWEPLDSLTDCAEAVSAFKRATQTGRVLPRPTPPPPAAAAAPQPRPPPIPPAGFTVDSAPPNDLGAALVGRTLLRVYWWSRRRRRVAARHWHRGTPLPARCFFACRGVYATDIGAAPVRGAADSLLDAASYGTRWVLLEGPGPPVSGYA